MNSIPEKTIPVAITDTLTFAGRMSVARLIWWGLVAICITLLLVALPLRFDALRTPGSGGLYALEPGAAALLAQYNVSTETYALYILLFEVAQMAGFWLIALWLFTRRPGEPMVVFTAITLMVTGTILPAPVESLRGLMSWQIVLDILATMAYVLTMVFVYVYPDGRFVPRQVRWFSRLGVLAILVLVATVGGDLSHLPAPVQTLLTLAWLGPGLASQLFRYRRVATEEQRQQLRWFIFGVLVLIGGALIRGLLGLVLPAASDAVRLLYDTLIAVPLLDTLLFLVFPLSLGVALARYRLYGLTLVINRSLISALVFAGLLLAFFLSFFAIQGVVALLNGSTTVALLSATFITTALFNPVRRWVRHQVDVHIFRLRLDLNQMADQERERRQPPPVAANFTGQQLEDYDLEMLIGQGGMGQVYRAVDRQGQTVAIKILPDVWLTDDQVRARFDREARLMMQLAHPQIVKLYAADSRAERPYIVMEYVDGLDLSDYLHRQGRIPLEETRRIIGQVATALATIHTAGIVHRDVKPSNVMLRRHNHSAVLMDFGVARDMAGKTRLTQTGVVGTLAYVAPEQIMQSAVVSPQVDQYALAVMTYQMLTGQLPFGGSVGQMVFAHLQEPPPDACALLPDLPAATALAIQRALHKLPEQRFPTVNDFAQAL
ncbi:MAG: serine/threonine protein kinase [Anaerolineae bacterium]|nr:serine/threonine protein kinase [Anaerolineae bacterium]